MSNNAAKYEVLIKQYLHSVLDVSAPRTASGLNERDHKMQRLAKGDVFYSP